MKKEYIFKMTNLSSELNELNKDFELVEEALKNSKKLTESFKSENRKLLKELEESQSLTKKLLIELNCERDTFQKKNCFLEKEIIELHNLFNSSKDDLISSNDYLKECLCSSTRKTIKIGIMFLKMKDKKQKINKKKIKYEKMSKIFANYIKEQTDLMRSIAGSKLKINAQNEKVNFNFKCLMPVPYFLNFFLGF